MLKLKGTIDTVKSKRVEQKEKGVVLASTMYWLVTLKVEADQVDANVLAHWANMQTVNVAMDTNQLALDLTEVTVTKPKKQKAGAVA